MAEQQSTHTGSEPLDSTGSSRRRLGFGVVALMVVAGGASFVGGTHRPLPGTALQSVLVLHIERSVGVFAVLLIALLILYRAFKGELPSEVSSSGVKYADAGAVETLRREVKDALEELRQSSEANTEGLAKLGYSVEKEEISG
jgi:hypothetical protein